MGMTNREIEAHRNPVVLHILMEHRIHIVESTIRMLVFVELSHDDAFDVTNESSHLHVVEHAIHLAHPLASILHEEDDVWNQKRVEIRTSQVVVDREIASHDDALCPTLDIQRMRRHSIGWQFALKHATKRLTNGIVALVSP